MDKVEEEFVSLLDDGKQDTLPVTEDAVVADAVPEFVVPEKFAGKSVEEVVESYVNLEKSSGRQANEIGELRKLTDQYLQQTLDTNKAPIPEPVVEQEVGFDDFVEDPAAAVRTAMANDPRLQALEENLLAQKSHAAVAQVTAKHPDAEEVIASSGLNAWLQENPSRARNFQMANSQMDSDTVNDMLSLYKQTQKVATEEAVTERDAIAAGALKEASVVTGSRSASTKPKYRRSELIQLKMHDKARYAAMEPEIRQAYAEGRVK